MKFKELMVDIETMGKAPDGAIVAIGAVPFSLSPGHRELAPRSKWLSMRITLESNVAAGRVMDPSTVEWWIRQEKAAQEALLRNERYDDHDEVREDFIRRVEKLGCERVWAKPPSFDVTMLRDFFGPVWPFHYAAERDLRSLIAVARSLNWQDVMKPELDYDGVKHEAIYDAALQAAQVIAFVERCATPR